MLPTPTPKERTLFTTAAYFDLFSFPLTPLELWKWCYVEPDTKDAVPSLPEVYRLLEESQFLRQRLAHREGFYFLRGQDASVATRKRRYVLAEAKYQRVLRAARAFRHLPFIRAIAVCNSLAYNNTREDGDLDLLIITDPRRIWTTRLLTTGLAALLGWRPSAGHARDAVCLSFFLAEDALGLQHLGLTPDDPYLRYWIDQLVPVYGNPDVLLALRSANRWYRERLPNSYAVLPSDRRWVRDTFASKTARALVRAVHAGRFGDALEFHYERLQRTLLPETLKRMANQDSRVVVNHRMLKFHQNDRRAEFVAQLAARLVRVP